MRITIEDTVSPHPGDKNHKVSWECSRDDLMVDEVHNAFLDLLVAYSFHPDNVKEHRRDE